MRPLTFGRITFHSQTLLLPCGLLTAAFAPLSATHADTPAAATPNTTAPATNTATNTAADTAALVKQLRTATLSPERRDAIEKELKAQPTLPVLQALIPAIALPVPSGQFWKDSGSAQGNAKAKAAWQIYYSVQRVWNAQLLKITPEIASEVGRAIVAYLPQVTDKTQLLLLLENAPEAGGFWTKEAQTPLLTLFRANKTPRDQRLSAMNGLLQNAGATYRTEIKEFIAQIGQTKDEELFFQADLLRNFMDITGTPNAPADPAILKMAFSALPPLAKANGDEALFLAQQLGTYVGANFVPDENDPKFRDGADRTPAFYAALLANAQKWWAASPLNTKK